jgi:uncharacterized membrane protein (DUF441 family)
MLFKRVQHTAVNQDVPVRSGIGTGLFANIRVAPVATDANLTMTVDQMAGGAVVFSSFSDGRNVTTPTAAAIIAAARDMDVGDSFTFIVSVTPAFAATWVAGTGVTLAGRATTPASSYSLIVVTETSPTTVQWYVM